MAGALQGWGSLTTKIERSMVGTLIDLSAIVLLAVPLIASITWLAPLMFRSLRNALWQRSGAALVTLPFGFVLWTLTVTAHEVKSERGSYPTMFDLHEGATNTSFLEGMLGFIGYQRIWLPALVGTVLAGVVLVVTYRRILGARMADVTRWPRWAMGLFLGIIVASGGFIAVTHLLGKMANRFTPAALGDPLTGLVESTVDLLQHKGPATPRALVLDAVLPEKSEVVGAKRLGWPPAARSGHPFRRTLPFSAEPRTKDPRGRKLTEAFERIGKALFDQHADHIALFHLSLEGFRADDIHALNPAARNTITFLATPL